jgi:hypothetical protein
LRETQQGIASRFGVLDQFDPEDYVNAGKALASLQERLQELRDGATPTSVDEGLRIQATIDKMGDLAASVQRVQVEFGLSAEKAGEFAAAVSAFQTAGAGTEAQASALRSVRAILIDALSASGKMTEEQEKFARQVLESEQSLLAFVAATADAEAGTAATADQARQLDCGPKWPHLRPVALAATQLLRDARRRFVLRQNFKPPCRGRLDCARKPSKVCSGNSNWFGKI